VAWISFRKSRNLKPSDWISHWLVPLRAKIFDSWGSGYTGRIDPIFDIEEFKAAQQNRSEKDLRLLDIFINLISHIQRFAESPTGTASDLSDQLNRLIVDARSAVVNAGASIDEFNDALFPLLAWIDERISLMHHWDGSDSWQDFLLQRLYFRTSLAGIEFFERLEALDDKDEQIREVFLMCLCLGFMGKYNTEPDASDLAEIRMKEYRLYQMNAIRNRDPLEVPLFPFAYQRDDEPVPIFVAPWKKWLNIRNLVIVGVPVIVLIVMLIVLNHTLGEEVDTFRKATQL
jgi:type VI secretion system protein ImpK